MNRSGLLSYSYATRFTVIFCTVTALILPVGYFVVSYKYLKGILFTEAEINGELVSRLINSNPELWRYETIRIEELLARRPSSGDAEVRRLFDIKNELVAESVDSLPLPQLTMSHEVSDSGETVGRIEISRSMLPILLKSSVLAFLGMGFGLLLYRWLPFRAAIKAGRQLQDTNDFLRKVMEGSTNSLIVLDENSTIQTFNGRFELLSGFSHDELAGREFVSLFAGDTRDFITVHLAAILDKAESHCTFETVLPRRDGSLRNISCGAVPLLRDGIISGVVLSLDDITGRITAEAERLSLERQLQQTQKLESLGVLAGGIAHDFNNILTIILGYCYVFKEEEDSAEIRTDYVLKIEDAANRAADLCRQMLSYAGKSELQHVPINMNQLVTEIVQMLHSGIKKNVTFELELPEAVVIIGDNSQIQQVVMNLIINAAEAIGDRQGTITVSLEKAEILKDHPKSDFNGNAIAEGRYVCLNVSDNGCGMDSETISRIFEPFFTTKFTGRGLGMSSTLGIIKSHDGALQLASTPGTGTTFTVYLPIPGVITPAEHHLPLRQVHESTARGAILLVDDEEELRTLGTVRLSKIGYSTHVAATGVEALEMFQKQDGRFDLILLDLLMPDLDGITTYRQFRLLSPTIPIVFCSGCSQEDVPADILEDPQAGFLKKPYKPDQLRNILFEMLGHSNGSTMTPS